MVRSSGGAGSTKRVRLFHHIIRKIRIMVGTYMPFTESPYNSTLTRDRYFNYVWDIWFAFTFHCHGVTALFGASLNVSIEIKQLLATSAK